MNAQEMNRKMFLRLTLTGVATTALGACSGEDPVNTMPVGPGSGVTGAGTTGGPATIGTAASSTTSSTTGFGTTGGGTTSGGTTGGGTTTGGTTGGGTTSSTTGFGTTGGGTTSGGTTSSTTGFGTTGNATTGGQGTMTGTQGGTGMGTGTGAGGTGGMNGGSCTAGMLSLMQTSNEMHTHLPLMMNEQTDLVMLINSGGGGMLTFAGPDDHTHTLTFDAQEVTMLAGGGTLTGKESSEDNFHTHTYSISCG